MPYDVNLSFYSSRPIRYHVHAIQYIPPEVQGSNYGFMARFPLLIYVVTSS